MAASNSAQRRLFLILASVAVTTLLVVGVLLFQTRTTVVEIEAVLERLDLTVEPPAATYRAGKSASDALGRVDLLDSSLRARRIDLQGAGSIEAFLAGTGRTTLRPVPGDLVRLTAAEDESLQPALQLHGPTRLSLESTGRDRAGHRGLRLTLEGAEPWSATVPTGAGLTLDRQGDGTGFTHGEVPADSPDLTAVGGHGDDLVSLSLPPDAGRGTTLRLVDPATGKVQATHLPFVLSAPQVLSWHDQLALLEATPTAATPLLRPDLKVTHLRFFHTDRFEEKSFLQSGKVRFPAGDREPLDLEPRTLLTLKADQPLTLRSLTLTDGKLGATLWGRVTSLRLGPTPDLQSEELPNLFIWIYTQRLRTLVYSTVASMLGLCLGAIKLLGLFKNESS
ncbi:MAG TPA: hypothetical protein VLX28_06780 [Thermoanaerobaculia bacterium]|nr:hypothetical protein [Thermoanaerobaculia bacterium]